MRYLRKIVSVQEKNLSLSQEDTLTPFLMIKP